MLVLDWAHHLLHLRDIKSFAVCRPMGCGLTHRSYTRGYLHDLTRGESSSTFVGTLNIKAEEAFEIQDSIRLGAL